jgi:tetratricopeptide (TPR) repeat protein
MIRRSASSSPRSSRRALESSAIGDHEAALDFYNQCLALAPSVAWRYHLRANARASLGDVDGALDDFSRAIAFGHTDDRVFHDRGLHRSQVGDESGALEALDEAELALREAIALDPQWREYARTADERRALRGRVDD